MNSEITNTTVKNLMSKILNQKNRSKFIKKKYNYSKNRSELFNKSKSLRMIFATFDKNFPLYTTKNSKKKYYCINSFVTNNKTFETIQTKKKSTIFPSLIPNNLTKYETEPTIKNINFLNTQAVSINNKYNLALAYSENHILDELKQRTIFPLTSINSLYQQKLLLDLIKGSSNKNLNTLDLENDAINNCNIYNDIFDNNHYRFFNCDNDILYCNSYISYKAIKDKEETNEDCRYGSEYRNKMVNSLKLMPNKSIMDEPLIDSHNYSKSIPKSTFPNIKQNKNNTSDKIKLINISHEKNKPKNENIKLYKCKKAIKDYNIGVLIKSKKGSKSPMNDYIYRNINSKSLKNKKILKNKDVSIKKPIDTKIILTKKNKVNKTKKNKMGIYLKNNNIDNHSNHSLFENIIFLNKTADNKNKSARTSRRKEKEIKTSRKFNNILQLQKKLDHTYRYKNPISRNILIYRYSSKEAKSHKNKTNNSKQCQKESKYNFIKAKESNEKYNKSLLGFNNIINDAVSSLNNKSIFDNINNNKTQRNCNKLIGSPEKFRKKKGEVKNLPKVKKEFNILQTKQNNKIINLKLHKKSKFSEKILSFNNSIRKNMKKNKKVQVKFAGGVTPNNEFHYKNDIEEKNKFKNNNNFARFHKNIQSNVNQKNNKERKVLKIEIELGNDKISETDYVKYRNTFESFESNSSILNLSSFEKNVINRTDENK